MHDLPPPKPFVQTITPRLEWALASIVKIPPAKPAAQSYEDLVCTEEDKAVIAEIITILGENNKLSLLFKQNHLKALGTQIDHLHPMKFLTAIFNDPQLKMYMNGIFEDYFKRNGFMDGLGPSMTREQEKGKLQQYIPDFAKELHVPAESIRPYFQASDWEGLVRFLIDFESQ